MVHFPGGGVRQPTKIIIRILRGLSIPFFRKPASRFGFLLIWLAHSGSLVGQEMLSGCARLRYTAIHTSFTFYLHIVQQMVTFERHTIGEVIIWQGY